jgi:hypothetical protein
VLRITQVPAHHVHKGGIALGGPYRRDMPDQPNRSADDPEAKPKADSGSERAVDDRDRARRAAEQDRFGQRAMNGRVEAGEPPGLAPKSSASPRSRKRRAPVICSQPPMSLRQLPRHSRR